MHLVLIPAFKKAGANLITLVTSGGMSAFHHGKKMAFLVASTDIEQALDESVDTVVIATQIIFMLQAIKALEKGKNIFVENR